MLLVYVSLAVLSLYTLLIMFYYRQWKGLKIYQPSASPSVAVSVIVAARNEAETLPHLLHDLQEQEYPADLLEVIVVDDFSTDTTADLAGDQPQNFRVI
ncbi:MAG: glycosyltransferase, partial [Bacteroidota bacterium]|nr:glycosyltransferase [Bacteroidota bacterium]